MLPLSVSGPLAVCARACVCVCVCGCMNFSEFVNCNNFRFDLEEVTPNYFRYRGQSSSHQDTTDVINSLTSSKSVVIA